jgi:hypothetical protein
MEARRRPADVDLKPADFATNLTADLEDLHVVPSCFEAASGPSRSISPEASARDS